MFFPVPLNYLKKYISSVTFESNSCLLPIKKNSKVCQTRTCYFLISGEKEGKIENKKHANTRFYGPASNCNELGKLGYTLNGYYLVKGNGESISNSVEAVLCQFNLPMAMESKRGKNETNYIAVNNTFTYYYMISKFVELF